MSVKPLASGQVSAIPPLAAVALCVIQARVISSLPMNESYLGGGWWTPVSEGPPALPKKIQGQTYTPSQVRPKLA